MGLNAKQKEAVEYLDGPLLVLAGPGTGKTQLLSEKVCYILNNTDTGADSILCLTFTESGAYNMRERLKSLIGKEALKVTIGTYHAFGQEILAKYKSYAPEYKRALDKSVDEVTQYKIIKEIRDKLPARDILHGDKVRDIISVISEAKSAGLRGEDLAKIAAQNIEDAKVLSDAISPLLQNVVPRVFEESYNNAYLPIYQILEKYENSRPIVGRIERSIAGMARDLKAAINEALSVEKITPLTDWRNSYFEKDSRGNYRVKDRVANLKLASVARVMTSYQEYLEENGLFDFDDMIIEAVRVLKTDAGFKATMQEKYQFIMLDEFQDTNPMQLMIVKQLTDYEKPMIMAVGDDDQAIYEFQGATATNLTDFQEYYGAKVVTLTENYRSTQEILDFSKQIIDQASNRYVNEKPLTAHKPAPKTSEIHRIEFLSSDQEYNFIADKIMELLAAGVKQSEIAIISAKHKYFMPLLPYLKEHPEIKIAYEKRDNLLEDEKIHQILMVMRAANEIATMKRPTVSMLEVLSYPLMGVSTMELITKVAEAREAHKPVYDYLLSTETSPELVLALEFLGEIAKASFVQPFETVLSMIVDKMNLEDLDSFEVFRFYENLASLRDRLTKYVGEKTLRVSDFVQMADDYEEAGLQLTLKSPYRDADEAVQVLSAHKAKGLEFEYVFVISADHTAWGKGKGNNTTLSLPKNLLQIRHTGMTDGEQIRLLYVALTRAKKCLFITNSLYDFSGKSPERLEYFDEYAEQLDGGLTQIVTPFLPFGRVMLGYLDGTMSDKFDKSALQISANSHSIRGLKDYLKPFVVNKPDMRAIYKERVKNYRMSASSLTSFIDIVNAGPVEFFKNVILRAEQQPEDESLAIGNLVHATFEKVTNSGLSNAAAIDFYLSELEKKDLPVEIKDKIRDKGPEELMVALKTFSRILSVGKAEVDFSYEHLLINGVPVTGKIDHITIDEENKSIEIYDFKTGKYRKDKWASHPTLYKYAMQLGFYKLLLNNSPTYAGYKVQRAHILFVRPDNDGEVYDKVYEFDDESENELTCLISAVYHEIVSLHFMDDPEIFVSSNKELKMKDIKDFVEKLIDKNS